MGSIACELRNWIFLDLALAVGGAKALVKSISPHILSKEKFLSFYFVHPFIQFNIMRDDSRNGIVLPYKGVWPTIDKTVFCASNATIIGDVEIGEYSSIWFQTVVRGDVFPIRIGKKTNIQDLSVCHVTEGQWSLTVEDEVTVGHRVILHGCHIRSRSLIGMGSVVLDGAVIEEEAIVAAGSVVTQGAVIPARTLVVGVPAKPKRDLTLQEIQMLRISVEHYVTLAQTYSLETK